MFQSCTTPSELTACDKLEDLSITIHWRCDIFQSEDSPLNFLLFSWRTLSSWRAQRAASRQQSGYIKSKNFIHWHYGVIYNEVLDFFSLLLEEVKHYFEIVIFNSFLLLFDESVSSSFHRD